MTVFEVFAREKAELSNSDVARFMDLPESSTSDLLHTLHQGGYLMRTARSRRFYPTSRLYNTAREIVKNDPLFAAGAEALELLAHKTGETVFASVLDEGAVKIIAAQEGGHALRYILKVGERIALNGSAMGKALLDLIGPDDAAREMRRKPMRSFTSRTITDPVLLQLDVERQREWGWFQADQEGNEGVTAYAIAGYIGSSAVALSVAGPSDRLMRARESIVAALRELRPLVFSSTVDNAPTQIASNPRASTRKRKARISA